jgi:hypothetical protein
MNERNVLSRCWTSSHVISCQLPCLMGSRHTLLVNSPLATPALRPHSASAMGCWCFRVLQTHTSTRRSVTDNTFHALPTAQTKPLLAQWLATSWRTGSRFPPGARPPVFAFPSRPGLEPVQPPVQ